MEDLNKILAEILEVEQVNSQDIITEFEVWDSLTALSIIAAIGEKYNVYLSSKEIMEARTIKNLEKTIISKINN